MIPWENTSVKNMIYFTLFGTGAYANKQVTLPGREESITIEELVTEFLRRGQRRFEKKHKECSILETEWFEEFMKYCQPFPAIRDYLYDKNKEADSRGKFLDNLLNEVREYSVFDTRTVLSAEEKVLREYFGILISIVGNIIKTFRKSVTAEDLALSESSGRTTAEYREWKRQKQMEYLLTLTDRGQYIKLIKEYLELGGRDDWERSSLHEYPPEVYQKRHEMRLLRWDYFSTPGNQTVREWMESLMGEAWEHNCADYLMNWLRKHKNSEIPAPIRHYITQYYNRNISRTDFCLKPFAYENGRSNRNGRQVLTMLYFALHFSLEIPPDKTDELLFLCKYPPEAGCEWLPYRYMTEEELCRKIANNLTAGNVHETVLSWNILYCMDHPDDAYTDSIARVAKNQLRKKWVRQIAMQYICKRMDADTACEQLLPRMQGDMFFFVTEQYRRAGSARLASMVWCYGEKYATHKLRCDVMLIHLQDKNGINSFINHIEKRHLLPVVCREYRAVEAIRNISAPELTGELERFFALGLKNNFRDDPDYSVLDAAADALVRMAAAGPVEYTMVENIFNRYLDLYQDSQWKKDKIESCLCRLSHQLQ